MSKDKKTEADLGTGAAEKTRKKIKKKHKKTSGSITCMTKGMGYDQATGKCK